MNEAFSGSNGARTWRGRLVELWRAAAPLLATRKEMFREEAAIKAGHLLRAGIGFGLALLFVLMALLLSTAFVAALLAKLLGGPVAGILAALVLYLVVGAGAGLLGWKTLSRVRPLDFPVTGAELKRDWEAVRPKAAQKVEDEEETEDAEKEFREESDLEARFRERSE